MDMFSPGQVRTSFYLVRFWLPSSVRAAQTPPPPLPQPLCPPPPPVSPSFDVSACDGSFLGEGRWLAVRLYALGTRQFTPVGPGRQPYTCTCLGHRRFRSCSLRVGTHEYARTHTNTRAYMVSTNACTCTQARREGGGRDGERERESYLVELFKERVI